MAAALCLLPLHIYLGMWNSTLSVLQTNLFTELRRNSAASLQSFVGVTARLILSPFQKMEFKMYFALWFLIFLSSQGHTGGWVSFLNCSRRAHSSLSFSYSSLILSDLDPKKSSQFYIQVSVWLYSSFHLQTLIMFSFLGMVRSYLQ